MAALLLQHEGLMTATTVLAVFHIGHEDTATTRHGAAFGTQTSDVVIVVNLER
jgi:hypothetical protein